MAAIIISGIMLKKTKMFAGDPAPFVMELPAYHWPTWATFCAPCGSAAGPSSRRPAPSSCCPPSSCGSPPTSAGSTAPSGCCPRSRSTTPSWPSHRQRHRLDLRASRLGQLAGRRRLHHRPGRQGEHRRYLGILYGGGDGTCTRPWAAAFNGITGLLLPGVQPAVRPLLRGHRRHQA